MTHTNESPGFPGRFTVYLALGMLPDGTRDILGLWIETTECVFR